MAVIPMKEQVPFARFEQRDHGRNVEASERTGVHVPLRSNFIIVTAHGSKDCAEFIVDEWLPRKRKEASQGLYPLEWVNFFQRAYDEWKSGHDLPREGTAVLTWQPISPEQNARLRALGYTTVEDLASVPDTSLGQIGLDGRNLRDLARAWLAEGKEKGSTALELASVKTENESLKERCAALESRLTKLEVDGEKRKGKAA
jgi:hypothetical protein